MGLAVGGGAGSGGGSSKAVTRLEVVDPHLLIMFRDVMDSAETAKRLKVGGTAGGGGGGAGEDPVQQHQELVVSMVQMEKTPQVQ